MGRLSSDTPRDIEDKQIAHIRNMSLPKKMDLMCQMSQAARTVAMAGIRQRHPDESLEQHKWRLGVLMYGEDLITKAYGSFPQNGDRS